MKKFLKFVLIALVLLTITVVVCTLAFTDDHKTITLKRSVNVNATREQVFDYISHTENKAQWLSNPDEEIARTSTGTDATVGFVRHWKIQNPPEKGSETIIKIVDGTRVETKIQKQVNGVQFNATQVLSCVPVDNNKTTLTWENTFPIPLNFMARMLLGFAEMFSKSIDSQQAYEDGVQRGLEKEGMYKEIDEKLQKLKQHIENQ